MPRREQRWPIWKIAASTGACIVAVVVLVWLSRLAERAASPATTNPDARTPAMSFPAFLLMLALMAGILAVLGMVWLALRVREASKPAWERGGRRRR